MSEHLIAVKIPFVFHFTHPALKGASLETERVVGLRASSKTIMEYGYKPDGREEEEELLLGDSIEGRIAGYYEQSRAVASEDAPPHNCLSFVWYALGRATKLGRYDNYNATFLESVEPTALEPGSAYFTKVALGFHAMLGINRPGYNLSILGENSAMAISNNSALLSAYVGAEIRHFTPEPLQ